MLNFFKENIKLLNKKSPEACYLLKNTSPDKRYQILTSKCGIPTLSIIYNDGKSRFLHSKYDPKQEALQFISACHIKQKTNFIVSGLGLGYHLHELIRKTSSQVRIIVIEKNPSLAKLAFTHNDFSSVINHPGVTFHIGINPDKLEAILQKDSINLAIYGYIPIKFKPLIEFEKDYYTKVNNEIIQIYQKFRIDINTQAAFSKKFYKNIFDNGQSIINSPGIKTLKNKFKGCPAIVVSAGPSLDKNISLIKSARSNIIVISVGTALKPLLKNNIKPDFVVAVDPNEDTVHSFNIEAIPNDLYLIYDPCIPSSITSLFKDKSIAVDSKVSLAKWLSEHNEKKGSLGNVFSVAHSAFYTSRFFGCDPIILVGQDLSFDGHRMHCTGSFYNQASQDKINSDQTLDVLEYNKYKNLSPAITQALNIFDKYSNTTRAMETYKLQFKSEFNGCPRILNATEGGVNIPGAENISLREALHSYCQIKSKNKTSNSIYRRELLNEKKELYHSVTKQKRIFNRLTSELNDIENKFIINDKFSTHGEEFVLTMEGLYRGLLNDITTLDLMQGYDYLGFIEWNQRNRKILEAEEEILKNNILQLKIIRDRDFLSVLIKTSKYLSRGFECWLKLLN